MKENLKLTSVKLIKCLYENYKSDTVNTHMSLQKLTNRAMHLYLSDESFRVIIEQEESLMVSGSSF
jgi:hypothetical protein